MKPTQQILMSLGVFTLSTCIAVAQDSAPKGEGGGRIAEFLKRADANADGKISLEEFNEFSKRDTGDRFSKMDANADGFVDSTEMGQIGERLREGMRRPGGEAGSGGFRRPGAEGGEGGFRRPPGGSPEGEHPAPKPEGERPAPRPEGERPMPPEGQRPGGAGGPGGQGINIDEVFGRMDKNADGNVDKEEYIEFSKQEIETRFGRMDENTDGKVSKDEMKSGMERLRNMMRGPGGPGGPGGMRRPGGEGGPGGPPGGGEGGFRRPPTEGGTGRSRPEAEADAPKKDPA
jgi:hypothetical protein